MSGRLSNKVALVTGGSRGIGRAVALAFAKEGAALIGVHYASNKEAADATVRDIEALGTRAVAIGADLRDAKAAADSIAGTFRAAALAATGKAGLDILVNNAGIAVATPLAQTSEATFDDLMTINFKAPFFLIQTLANDIRDDGRIINVSTGFTRIAAPTHPAYAASKGALETLTLALAPDFASRGITVNSVMPGVTETDMNADWLATDARAGAEALSVFSRVGQPADVADVITFVASNDARWTTGQSIDATGGARI
ncbi:MULTISPECIES: SDR family NAD(P)-dependent oxidoreductase [unclassified Mesorhizobium]|uniref:SDR family NAD(P)-dependent oxidoreductase n=1 Tax=unclassified Mesorhizobium TaxID=325217 RepID=UPI000FDC94FD|nr:MULTISPECIES: SDR family NAD(P)-dependent oxidoreductase [unclassified Mesorhizobium]TGT73709.1 SDR family NAD(P)-dependent oxidoreductase [Mesorhizobium sp. M2E.F.Ca.ET.166.01.1.1]TGW00224.1 SDR family NAD(P)-dependent oxidoreductase [Mesorhizobium sp. M2E.F.Ca.ET.154.01.1.1]